jgi:hypothetical protein
MDRLHNHFRTIRCLHRHHLHFRDSSRRCTPLKVIIISIRTDFFTQECIIHTVFSIPSRRKPLDIPRVLHSKSRTDPSHAGIENPIILEVGFK